MYGLKSVIIVLVLLLASSCATGSLFGVSTSLVTGGKKAKIVVVDPPKRDEAENDDGEEEEEDDDVEEDTKNGEERVQKSGGSGVAKRQREVDESSSSSGGSGAVEEEEDEELAKRQNGNNIKLQVAMSCMYMVASRYIFKIDFTVKRVEQICRLVFCAYLLLSQLLFWFLKNKIEQVNDDTPVAIPTSSSIMGMPPSPPSEVVTDAPALTVKEYDLAELSKLSSGIFFEVLSVTYMHFVSKAGKPLLFVPMTGVMNKFKAPIVQIHLLGAKPIGQLARPFKTGMETFLTSVAAAAAPEATEANTSANATGATAELALANKKDVDATEKENAEGKEEEEDEGEGEEEEEEEAKE